LSPSNAFHVTYNSFLRGKRAGEEAFDQMVSSRIDPAPYNSPAFEGRGGLFSPNPLTNRRFYASMNYAMKMPARYIRFTSRGHARGGEKWGEKPLKTAQKRSFEHTPCCQ
jgi:hypothetical protein